MADAAPVKVTTTFATVVDDMAAAWSFIMAKVDLVGDDPQVVVNPVSCFLPVEVALGVVGDDEFGVVRRFEVSVSGMVEE